MRPLDYMDPALTWRDRHEWKRISARLAAWLRDDTPPVSAVRQQAALVRDAIGSISGFIEERTAALCPSCRQVCCRWENCRYDLSDLVYLLALGLPAPEFTEGLEESGPCRYLAPTGCTLPRHGRPFRCTWHFCDALVAHMNEEPQRRVRAFSASFSGIQALRLEMMASFAADIKTDFFPHRKA